MDERAARARFGYRRLLILLAREGYAINHKRVHRLYCLEGLQLRRRVRRRKHCALQRGSLFGSVKPAGIATDGAAGLQLPGAV